MRGFWRPCVSSTLCLVSALLALRAGISEEPRAARLPEGVEAVWDASRVYRERTPTRERISINGLWLWQPADPETRTVPAENWGYFKVPGCWPGITDYMQKDCQTVHAHPRWKETRLGGVTAAWYERQITIPQDWVDRRITVRAEVLNSLATVFVDGKDVGQMRFPGGGVDLTSVCHPGKTHTLSLLVVAMPLKGVLVSYTDTAAARNVQGKVARRGLCGDVDLVATPQNARISHVKVVTSVRTWTVTFAVALENLSASNPYRLRATVTDGARQVAEFTSEPFEGGSLEDGRITLARTWKPRRLWDLHTPENTYLLSTSLLDAASNVIDTAFETRFGFREFWIEGRDFFLNGTRVYLSAVPLDNAQVGAAWASYDGALESLRRLQRFGINFVYTHNYGCEPGSHLSFAEILRAADDVGMLVSLSQPHFSHYDWDAPDADEKNGYARHAEFYVRVAQNHPSVVAYAMSHNATGYSEDMNPDLIDGVQDPRDEWSRRNAKRALRAEAIVKRLDPARVIYHHSSGNLGSMHTSNFYPNFAPVQELSDWLEHWATTGVKPFFTCEYGAPFSWDWTMYRGWYDGERSFGSARVPWEFCVAEWNSQFLGDQAFQISEQEKTNLRWEARQLRAGNVWHRWDYPHRVGARDLNERYPVFAMYITDNWRAFRTWGLSANSPWEHGHFWKLRDGVEKGRKELDVDWTRLQRPGFSADYVADRYERMDLAFEQSDWVPTAAAEALIRNNGPLLAYIGGKPVRFTSKDHNFWPGDRVEKQLIVVNNSRETVRCIADWSTGLPGGARGNETVTVPTGEHARLPLRIELPKTLAPGTYELAANFRFTNGETQKDSFSIHVLPAPSRVPVTARIALFDPAGETGTMLRSLGLRFQAVDASTDLSGYEILVVGKSALTADGEAPDIAGVRDGLKVLVFEQTAEVLERRLGYRVAEYGLRQVFARVPDHPILAGITKANLRDWRGEATILPPRLSYRLRPRYGPTVDWCGIPVTRIWRCGNRGNVASVLMEKPERGNFLPIVEGGYSLEYAPVLELREGKGMVLHCQLDVTGRTEQDPAAETIVRNILGYVSRWKPETTRSVVYAGEPAGRAHLEAAGLAVDVFEGRRLSEDQVLVVGPGAGDKIAGSAPAIEEWLREGGHLLAVGLDGAEANTILPFEIHTTRSEHISSWFKPFGVDSPFAGIGPADVHNRDPRELPLVTEGALVFGNGVLARAKDLNVILCQIAPWRFVPSEQANLKRTHRRVSFLVTRLLGNMGVAATMPTIEWFRTATHQGKPEKRFSQGLYLHPPEEWDDPYRFFRW